MKSSISLFSFMAIAVLMVSCTVYTEKQSQALSRAVYATKDSIDKARLDLASTYSTESTRIVKPPKKRIPIDSVYKKVNTSIPVVASSAKPGKEIPVQKQRVLIIPEQYKHDTVVVVNSNEYQELLKDKETLEQLKEDLKNERLFKTEVDEELQRQKEYAEKMVKDLNIMQKKLVEKDLAILKRNVIIVVLIAIGVGGVYLRMKGVL